MTLDAAIAHYESKGYHVEDRAKSRVTMMRPKKFSFISLEVDESGQVTEHKIK